MRPSGSGRSRTRATTSGPPPSGPSERPSTTCGPGMPGSPPETISPNSAAGTTSRSGHELSRPRGPTGRGSLFVQGSDEGGQAHLRQRQGGVPQGVAPVVELQLPPYLDVDLVAVRVVVGQSQVDVGQARPRAGCDEPGLHATIHVEIGDILDRELGILREG